jgi:hypothetical protein
MKELFLLTFAALLFGCPRAAPSANRQTEFDSTVMIVEEPLFEVPVTSDLKIPPGILTDSILYFDSTLNLQVTRIYAYTVDTSQSAYKRQAYVMIDSIFLRFEKQVKEYAKEYGGPAAKSHYASPYMFDATPVNYYQDDRVVSIRYIVSTKTAGAVRDISGLLSVNYDKKTKNRITVDNYYSFKNRTDSNLIVSVLDKSFAIFREYQRTSHTPWIFYGIDHLDFNIRKDSVCFNFPSYILGQGHSLLEYEVHKSELSGVINPDYR